jgi:hypothetical protein
MSKVFVSFDYDNDKHYKYLLEAWHNNPRFQFTFEDGTPREINSLNVGRVKAALTAKIKEASHTLVIIGRHANELHRNSGLIGYRNWINFEIAKSKELGKRLVAVKLNRDYQSPTELLSSSAYWTYSFTEQNIIHALDAAPYPPIHRYV